MVITVTVSIFEVTDRYNLLKLKFQTVLKYFAACHKNLSQNLLTEKTLKLEHYFLSRYYKSSDDNKES